MVNTRRQGIKDGCNKKTRKNSFTARETLCHSTTSEVLWIINFCRRGIRDGHFWRRDTEKGLIITVRYLGLDFFASEVIEIEIIRKQTVTPLGKVLSMEIRRCSIQKVGGSMCVYYGFPPKKINPQESWQERFWGPQNWIPENRNMQPRGKMKKFGAWRE